MITTFYLTPDKFSAHYIRRELSSRSSLLGTQVGTWPELLELARTSYCLTEPVDIWQEKLAAVIGKVGKAFWCNSLNYDHEATSTIVSQALFDLLSGLGPGEKVTAEISNRLSKRGKKQIDDLLKLHKKMGGVFPEELTLIQNLLAVDSKQAIRQIRVHYVKDVFDLNVWQTALVNRLNSDAGELENEDNAIVKFANLISWPAPHKGTSSLRHLQRNLFASSIAKQKLSSGLQWLGCRDYRQEVEIAAGMVQNIMADSGLQANEIGLLVPETASYCGAVAEVFNVVGLPLSGLSTIRNSRDPGCELLYHFLLSRQVASPAPMLRASLFGSPLLPWSSQSVEVAQAIMDGDGLSGIITEWPEDQQKTARFLAGKQISTPVQLVKALRVLLAIISKGEDLNEHRRIGLALIHEMLAHLDEDDGEIHWDTLLRICSPKLLSQADNEDINLQGVRVFHPDKEPWQKVKHLLVLGFTEGSYPQTPGVYSVVSEEDRLILADFNIILPARSSLLKQRRERFQRQFCASSESITFLMPMMDSLGGRLKPSSSLSFMVQLFADAGSGEELILDLDQSENWQRVKHLAIAAKQVATAPRPTICNDLQLGENLLTKRKDNKGKTSPESPSGLETMMVSPLAWIFKRYHIDSHEWAIEELGIMTSGSIAHEIFEQLFSHKHPLPQKGRIPGKIESLFNQVVKQDYPFLEKEEWQLECLQMVRQFSEAAIGWLDFIKKNELEILGEETSLTGRFNKHPIRGKADLICRDPDGKLLVVDYKTSKSPKRKESMKKGFDHQASLYCQMLISDEMTDEIPVKLKNHLKKSPETGALYYTLRDQVVLGDSKAGSLKGVAVVTNDIAHNALGLIKERMKALRAGTVSLNTDADKDKFEKEAGITPYALETSPLINLFMAEGGE